MATKQFQCELSWSASRAKEFERCRRENWYGRYASWGWWTEKPLGEKYDIMVHKCLTSLPAYAGDCMHRAIERWFQLKQGGTTMSTKELYEEAVELFREGWRQSASDDWKARPNKSTHLLEHHYEVPIPKERTEAARELLERCANYFMHAPELAPVREAHPDNWRSLETMDTYQFLGTKIYAVPDFAYAEGDVVHIWDWKTGKPRDADIFQLHTYALYACEKWSVDPENIVLYAAYLGEEQVQQIPVDLNRLSHAQDEMSASLREMMDIHYDPDVDDLIIENWPASPEARKCGWCRFRGLCPDAVK
ncbi:MAG: PD-(D/E)XK nuclease family protein [Planctomycetota bacterium]